MMATKKQKQELIETLKFTPRTYTLTIGGYGGETYAGVVDRKIYDYFKAKQIDICQYAFTWDDDMWLDIPEDMRPFNPGDPYDCDNFFHMAGAELTNLNGITVSDEHGNTVLELDAGEDELDAAGVSVECNVSNEIYDLDDNTVVFWAAQGEKGSFFEGEIELRTPFDPKRLTIYCENCDGWVLISGVEYDGDEIDGSNGYSTNGKWSDAKWIIVGDEEAYEGTERNEGEVYEADWDPAAELDKVRESAEGLSAFQNLANALAERWNDVSETPPAKGTYECEFETGKWPNGAIREAEWTGRIWKENGKKATDVLRWREVEVEE